MPTIPFPNVPLVPGVPQVPRSGIGTDVITLAVTAIETSLLASLQSPQQWGIYDSSGNQLGAPGMSFTSLQSATAEVSTISVDYLKELRVSDFPIEMGSFASYNKVEMPANPVVALVMDGQESDRTAFLNTLDAAAKSTNLYSVATPEVTYANYSIDRYQYSRSASRGRTLFVVEVSLKEIRQVSATYTTSTPATSINNPQNPSATPQTNSGVVQSPAPEQSTLSSLLGGG